ncbi:MAG: hypothetical protein K0S09_912 [Sphingobacteriaceae bacterium]|nr:hypothetical protein [Sphingobacteriaceae bacterium]
MLPFIALLNLSLIVGGCADRKKAEVPYYNDATFTPVWNPGATALDKMHRIPPFNFTDQYNHKIAAETVKDKVYLANFFFTSCPSICPRLTKTMSLVQEHFKNNSNVLFISHSVTPEIDSVPKLYNYAVKNHVLSPQWHFITGNKEEIYQLARKSYFIEEETGFSKTSSQFLHTENFVLIDQKGHIRGIYNGTLEAEVPRIVEDIEALL